MRELKWSECLSLVALKHVRNCGASFGSNNPDRHSQAIEAGCITSDMVVGETIFSSTGSFNPIEIWSNQRHESMTQLYLNGRTYNWLIDTSSVGCASFDKSSWQRWIEFRLLIHHQVLMPRCYVLWVRWKMVWVQKWFVLKKKKK